MFGFAHSLKNRFEKLKELPISDAINQHFALKSFKFVTDTGPNYLNEVFLSDKIPLTLGPSKWKKLPGQ